MKILITGAAGMLGRELQSFLPQAGHEIIAAARSDLDITDAHACQSVIAASAPEVVINCAAMTAVDDCETEREKAFALNAQGPRNLAVACASLGVKLVHISTDYVFSGDKLGAYVESDPVGPRTVYGQSKLAGEEAVRECCRDYLIARIAWLYGRGGPSFLHTMLKLAQKKLPQLTVVNDQHGNPTSCRAVAGGLNALLAAGCRGVYHLTCEGSASWYDFAVEIFRQAGVAQLVVPCESSQYPRPARRPANSCLENAALAASGLPPLPRWQEALAEFFSLPVEE